jgi:hypothetical protein
MCGCWLDPAVGLVAELHGRDPSGGVRAFRWPGRLWVWQREHMACPKCNGSDRRAIAPNYYECTSRVTRVAYRTVPSRTAPPHLGITETEPVHLQETCMTRYHEGASSATPVSCYACTTDSIGSCGSCGVRVCGDHSSRVDQHRRLCSACAECESREREKERAEAERSRVLMQAGQEAKAEVAVAAVLRDFVARMQAAGTPTIELTGPNCRLVAVKSWRWATAYQHEGDPRGHGWFVPTPAHPGAVTHVDTSASETKYTEVLGLAVTATCDVFPASAPDWAQIVIRDSNIAMDLGALGQHTHGRELRTPKDVDLIATRLSQLLDAAARSPTGTCPRQTRREQRAVVEATYRWREEKIYGPGGYAASRKRTSGK